MGSSSLRVPFELNGRSRECPSVPCEESGTGNVYLTVGNVVHWSSRGELLWFVRCGGRAVLGEQGWGVWLAYADVAYSLERDNLSLPYVGVI